MHSVSRQSLWIALLLTIIMPHAVYADQDDQAQAGLKSTAIVDPSRVWDRPAAFREFINGEMSLVNVGTSDTPDIRVDSPNLRGKRLISMKVWYPIKQQDATGPVTKQIDYYNDDARGYDFARDMAAKRSLVFDQNLNVPPNNNMLRGYEQCVLKVNDTSCAKATVGAQVLVQARHSYKNKPLDMSKAPFPVIIYSPGTGGVAWTNDTLFEDLAKRGYIVVAINHTGDSDYNHITANQQAFKLAKPEPFFDLQTRQTKGLEQIICLRDVPNPGDQTPCFNAATGTYSVHDRLSNKPEDFQAFIVSEELALVERALDIQSVLQWLKTPKAAEFLCDEQQCHSSDLFKIEGNGNLAQVGILGYSRGGSTVRVAETLFPEVKAAFSLVGPGGNRILTPAGICPSPLITPEELRDEVKPFRCVKDLQLQLRGTVSTGVETPHMTLFAVEDFALGYFNQAISQALYPDYPVASEAHPAPYELDDFANATGPAIFAQQADTGHADYTDFPDIYLHTLAPPMGKDGNGRTKFWRNGTYVADLNQSTLTRNFYVHTFFDAYLTDDTFSKMQLGFDVFSNVTRVCKNLTGNKKLDQELCQASP